MNVLHSSCRQSRPLHGRRQLDLPDSRATEPLLIDAGVGRAEHLDAIAAAAPDGPVARAGHARPSGPRVGGAGPGGALAVGARSARCRGRGRTPTRIGVGAAGRRRRDHHRRGRTARSSTRPGTRPTTWCCGTTSRAPSFGARPAAAGQHASRFPASNGGDLAAYLRSLRRRAGAGPRACPAGARPGHRRSAGAHRALPGASPPPRSAGALGAGSEASARVEAITERIYTRSRPTAGPAGARKRAGAPGEAAAGRPGAQERGAVGECELTADGRRQRSKRLRTGPNDGRSGGDSADLGPTRWARCEPEPRPARSARASSACLRSGAFGVSRHSERSRTRVRASRPRGRSATRTPGGLPSPGLPCAVIHLPYEQRHRLHQRQPRPLRRRAEGTTSPSRASARCRSTRPTCARCAEWTRRRDAPHRPAERAARSRRPATRSSTATGWARPARRRSCSTATTTCSRSIRSSCGSRRRSRRRCATARSTRAARPTTRARSSCTSRPSRRT